MSKYLRPLLAVLLFVVIQGITSVFVMLGVVFFCMYEHARQTGESIFTGSSFPDMMPQMKVGEMSAIMIISGLVTLLLLVKPLSSLRWPKAFDIHDVQWRKTPAAIVGCVAGVLAVNLLCEHLNLPDWTGEDIIGLMDSVPGVLAVGVLGPVVEEAVFRESLLGELLLQKVTPWKAILISALLFGLIHGNPAQIPAACIIGLLLGVVYWKTGNIVLPILLHIANNLFCVAQYWVMGEAADNFSMSEWMGGDPVAMVVATLSAMLCIGAIAHFVRDYPVVMTPENSDDDIKYI